jgi:hypothetical protein
MLQKLSEQIQSCYERAAEAKRKAGNHYGSKPED